ncbi:sensor histidine kinase [Dyadobacter psychrotolerans]|uniref:histidine kinase n=1 Tax=Dyadobacter psychrotolerans TaxID=2541721 RepID=A0A4R5DS88_9BACT|nr:ATP-binding protein [Dyadobacter psychrotolerans]TDE17199.1 GAF domain-containing protein [Dyadobacter psychrotolerans]
MKYSDQSLAADIEKIKLIPIISTMLEVICRTTGMGFAAIARVTEDRWIACSVRDEIDFGLKDGGELEIKTTICDQIRDYGRPVVIDHVAESPEYYNHHTPLMYGFQSYISVPIVLKTGEFFGTLCAIDPKPASLNNTETIGMFNLFAELISFHLQSIDLMERSHFAVKELSRQLTDSKDENRQYQYISNHNLQEPLRKIRVFSSMLIGAAEKNDPSRIKAAAEKINSSAQRFSMMIQDLSDFSELNNETNFESVDLNDIVSDVIKQLDAKLKEKGTVLNAEILPTIFAVRLQMEQLFYHLVSNAIRFSKNETPLTIKISAHQPEKQQIDHLLPPDFDLKFTEIRVEDNGVGIEKAQLEKIFDIFSKLPSDQILEGAGIGLAYCRKIIRNHNGNISAQSDPGEGTSFSLILPVNRKTA